MNFVKQLRIRTFFDEVDDTPWLKITSRKESLIHDQPKANLIHPPQRNTPWEALKYLVSNKDTYLTHLFAGFKGKYSYTLELIYPDSWKLE